MIPSQYWIGTHSLSHPKMSLSRPLKGRTALPATNVGREELDQRQSSAVGRSELAAAVGRTEHPPCRRAASAVGSRLWRRDRLAVQGLVRSELYRLSESLPRCGIISEPLVNNTEVVPAGGIARLDLDSLLVARPGRFEVAVVDGGSRQVRVTPSDSFTGTFFTTHSQAISWSLMPGAR